MGGPCQWGTGALAFRKEGIDMNDRSNQPALPGAAAAPETPGRSANGKHKGSLVVVGTGIRTVGHLTIEAVAWIKQADKVLYVVGDPVAESMLKELNTPGDDSMTKVYDKVKKRIASHDDMLGQW